MSAHEGDKEEHHNKTRDKNNLFHAELSTQGPAMQAIEESKTFGERQKDLFS